VAVAHTSPPVTIPAGTQSVPVPVMVLGDATDENDEQFSVRLANAVNATITGGGVWRGTIVDDDLPPTISVADCTRVEGNTGSVPCAFVVSLSNPSAFPIGVSYATADGTAVAGSDYTQTSGTLSFPLETATTTAPVSILGDTSSEPSETFLVNLSAPTGGAIGDGQAVGTIIDDEAMKFYPVTPCRVLDTRVLGGPVQAGQKRTFPVATQTCPLPATAKAVIVNVTATQETKSGNLRLYPAGLAAPMTSVLNFAEGVARANNATVLVGASGQLTVQCDMAAAGSTQVIVDVFGYYE
jgi:hypothetical protein